MARKKFSVIKQFFFLVWDIAPIWTINNIVIHTQRLRQHNTISYVYLFGLLSPFSFREFSFYLQKNNLNEMDFLFVIIGKYFTQCGYLKKSFFKYFSWKSFVNYGSVIWSRKKTLAFSNKANTNIQIYKPWKLLKDSCLAMIDASCCLRR